MGAAATHPKQAIGKGWATYMCVGVTIVALALLGGWVLVVHAAMIFNTVTFQGAANAHV